MISHCMHFLYSIKYYHIDNIFGEYLHEMAGICTFLISRYMHFFKNEPVKNGKNAENATPSSRYMHFSTMGKIAMIPAVVDSK